MRIFFRPLPILFLSISFPGRSAFLIAANGKATKYQVAGERHGYEVESLLQKFSREISAIGSMMRLFVEINFKSAFSTCDIVENLGGCEKVVTVQERKNGPGYEVVLKVLTTGPSRCS